MDAPRCRRAVAADLEALVALERLFPGDRLSPRSLRRLLTRPSADIWVSEDAGRILGDAVVLYRRGSTAARLYSIVVEPAARGRGIAAALMGTAEAAAKQRGCRRLCLEVRSDNAHALALYRKLGYRVVEVLARYYDDGQDGLRLERALVLPQPLAA